MKGNKKNGVFILDGETEVATNAVIDRTKLLHLRLGHIGEMGLKELEKQGVIGNDRIRNLEFCEYCVLGKSTRASFHRSTYKSKDKLEYVHSDLWGPAQ